MTCERALVRILADRTTIERLTALRGPGKSYLRIPVRNASWKPLDFPPVQASLGPVQAELLRLGFGTRSTADISASNARR
jgi:hypothetical protein